jgi:hypothetical protein
MSLAQPSAAHDPRARLRAARRGLFLWTAQAWLAMFFVAAGYAKLTEPAANLVALLGWPAGQPLDLVRGIGTAEIVLALGMIAPGSSGAGRRVVVICAMGLAAAATTMLAIHLFRAEAGLAIVNGVLIALAGMVAWGRSRPGA